jgi:hypothetical protein
MRRVILESPHFQNQAGTVLEGSARGFKRPIAEALNAECFTVGGHAIIAHCSQLITFCCSGGGLSCSECWHHAALCV